jgi:hypothetical protein
MRLFIDSPLLIVGQGTNMDTENAIRTIQGHLDALTLIVGQLLGESLEPHRKHFAERIWANADKYPSVERDSLLIELIGEPRR